MRLAKAMNAEQFAKVLFNLEVDEVVWVNEYRKGEGKKSNKVYKVGKIEE